MLAIHAPQSVVESLVEERRRTGAGRLDECWEGVWHLTDPTLRHQQLAFRICRILAAVIEDSGRGSDGCKNRLTRSWEGEAPAEPRRPSRAGWAP